MNILIDWLEFTTKIHSKLQVLEMLGLQEQEWFNGKSTGRWTSVEMLNKIRIESGGERDDIHIVISGSGCRYIETVNDCKFDWMELLKYLEQFNGDGVNISRLDVACDERNGVLQMAKIVKHSVDRKYISKSRLKPLIKSCREEDVYFGSGKSDTMLRIYNKALERDVDEQWIRVELQLRDDAADSFIVNMQEYKEIGRTYAGVLLNYLRFTTQNPANCQNNHNRLKTAKWWAEFIGGSEKIKNITTEGMEYNYESLENFIKTNVGSSIKTYLIANNGDVSKLLELLEDVKINDRQKQLLNNLCQCEYDQVEGWQ